MKTSKKPYSSASIIKKMAIALIVTSLCTYGFAIDNLIDGGKKSKTFSTIKADLNFSLKNGYNFHNYKVTSVKRAPNVSGAGYYITYQRENVTLGMPYKGKSKLLQKFKTPERPR